MATAIDFQVLFESAPGLYLVLAPDLSIVAASDAYLQATMTQRHEILGRGLFEVFPDNPEELGASSVSNLRASLERVLADGVLDVMAAQKYDIRRPEAEGGGFEERFWSPVNSPVFGPDRQVAYVIHCVQDITDRMRVNEALQAQNEELLAREERFRAQSVELADSQAELTRRNEELARASRLKSDFLASMSHELRTPLNAVIGFSDLLLSGDYGKLDATQTPVLRDISAAGTQLLTLINEVLDLSKIEAGRIEVHAARVDLAEPVGAAGNMVAGTARKRSIEVVNRVSKGAIFAIADPDRVRQVLINLASNAVKFTPDGGTVTIEASSSTDRVRVSVTDTGIGIAPADAPKLFAPFSQLDSGYARRFQGTGLGLSICKRLVELMGGAIGFTSEPGKGSTFFFTLPAAPERAAPTPYAMRAVRGTVPPPSRANGGRATVLVVVSDEEPAGLEVESGLRRAGYFVARARNVEDALARIDAVKPTLLVVDLGLPGLSGFEFIERIRALAPWKRTPIAVFSAGDLSAAERVRLAPLVELIVQKGEIAQAVFFEQLAMVSVPPRLRVLVVDDSEMNRKVIRAMLQHAGCEVLEVADAASGLRAAAEEAPAVILMDIQMPGMDGLMATTHLMADPATSAIPVIAVTAHAMGGDAERALAAGCVAYVSKPIARAKLFEALDLALGGAGWRLGAGVPRAEG
jgi:signal transduction histidine kinase/CheY-like chemotaxis protein